MSVGKKILDDIIEFGDFAQKNSTAFLLLFIVLGLIPMYFGMSNKYDEDIRDVHRYYDCVFENMHEGKDEYQAKKYCSDFDMEMQESQNEYYEEMRP